MLMKPVPLSRETLSEETLKKDRKASRRFGPCSVGEQALYLNSFFMERRYYVPITAVRRVFKRVAMSKGGFTGRGVFAAIPYLVVVYDDGQEKQCNFKFEEQVDALIAYFSVQHPEIPIHSEAAEKRIAARAAEKAARKRPQILPSAQKAANQLEKIQDYLEERPALYPEMTAAARKKRTFARSRSSYPLIALAIALLGIGAAGGGVYAMKRGLNWGVWFLLFALAAIFLFSALNVMPTAKRNERAINERLEQAVKAVETYISGIHCPVPAHYAHPITLKRMRETIEWGRAKTAEEAFNVVCEDLRQLNSDVEVDQEEYDEIMAIKPLFLIYQYQ